MTFEIILAFAILIGALVVFTFDLFPIDFVAFAIMALILVLGPILGVKPEEAISGFSNPATITVLAMFILSAGINRTGVINLLIQRLSRRASGSRMSLFLMLILIVGPASAFINNTAVVAILLPVVITLARDKGHPPSKLLIPLSYLSQLAGVITLIGTSTNVLASTLTAQEGQNPFGMFEFAHVGLLIFVTGVLYLLLIGQRLLPERQVEPEVLENYHIKEYLSEIIMLDDSPLVGKNLIESHLRDQFDIDVLDIIREGEKLSHPLADQVVQTGDILFVKGNPQQLLGIKDARGFAIAPEVHLSEQELKSNKMNLMEVVIGPNSPLIGGTLENTSFRQHYNCTVIAIRKDEEIIQERLSQVRLNFGDTLLLRGAADALKQMKREPSFIVTEEIQLENFRTEKVWTALGIVVAVVTGAALGWPILVTALAGCVLMVITGCLNANELHEAIRWDVIFLLAGVLPLGLALEKTGGAHLIANLAAQSAVYVSPLLVLAIFYLIAMVLTELISNNAVVVVMVPISIATAKVLGLDPRAFVLAIMFAASTSFSTPVGYQTNTMVYGPGGYKFLDFTRIGLPLNLLLAVTTPIYIYLLWGL